MKKLLTVLLAALLAVCLAVPALADVIWEPYDDFWYEYRDECVYLGENVRFEARADALLYDTPETQTDMVLPAGTVVTVGYTWQSDVLWGAVEGYRIGDDYTWTDGWVELAGFRKLYGPADFDADHGGEMRSVEGSVPVSRESEVTLWLFPGSGEVVSTAGGPDSWEEEDVIVYSQVWTDADGNDWGRITYYYGLRDCWIFLSDPAADDLPATAPRYADEEPAPVVDPEPVDEPTPEPVTEASQETTRTASQEPAAETTEEPSGEPAPEATEPPIETPADTQEPTPYPEKAVQPAVPILVIAVIVIVVVAAAAAAIVVMIKKKRQK